MCTTATLEGDLVYALVSLGDVADVSQIVGLVVAVPVIVLAWKQLVSATAASEAQAVLALDDAFGQFEDLRKQAESGLEGAALQS